MSQNSLKSNLNLTEPSLSRDRRKELEDLVAKAIDEHKESGKETVTAQALCILKFTKYLSKEESAIFCSLYGSRQWLMGYDQGRYNPDCDE